MSRLSPSRRLHYALWLLRAGLAFVFAYAAISAFVTPDAWLGFIPSYVPTAFAKPSLDFFSVVQLVLAVWLLWGRWLRYAAAAAALLIIALTLSNLASLVITFRDIGLALAATALALLAEND
jgi:uncharacterized membrane protein